MLENKVYLSIENGFLSSTSDHPAPTSLSGASPSGASLSRASLSKADVELLWQHASTQLQESLDPQIYNAWVKPLHVVHFEFALSTDGTQSALVLELGGPNRFTCDHLRQNYGDTISKNIRVASGIDVVEIVFKVVEPVRAISNGSIAEVAQAVTQKALAQRNTNDAPEIKLEIEPGSERSKPTRIVTPGGITSNTRPSGSRRSAESNEARQNGLDFGALNPKCNFSSFVVGPCNQFAHAASLRVAENPGGSYNPLFVYGGVGLGKTHLVSAIGNAARRRGKNVLLSSSEVFVNELISALRSNRMQQFRDRFRSLDLLIIDDIQFLIGKERTQEEFFHTFNALHQRRSQIVITSDKVPQDLVGLEERLRTRFASGLSADLQAPDFETRVAILLKKSETEGLGLPNDVASLLAEKIDTNVRELEGALNRLHAFSALHNIPITLELAENALRTIVPERTREVTTELIQKTVSERFNTSIRDLVGKRRTQNIALPRQVAMHLCRKLTTCSYPEIGALFGGRDHSTVIHAYRVIEERMTSDSQLKNDVEWLERKLRGR